MTVSLALVSALACAGEPTSPERERAYSLTTVKVTARPNAGYKYVNLDTSVNRARLRLVGSLVAGAARVQGEWWLRYIYGTLSLSTAVIDGDLSGTYGRFDGLLYLELQDRWGRRHWLSLIPLRGLFALEGVWEDEELHIYVRFERASL